jgi:multiple sugar transport system ATP-binding protein
VLEWLGSDMYAYFSIQGSRATARELEELAADAGAVDIPGAGDQIVARLDTGSRAREGQRLDLWWDVQRVHLFNPDDGANLTL